MNLPDNWARVKRWLLYRGPITTAPTQKHAKPEKKCPEVRTLENYVVSVTNSFGNVSLTMVCLKNPKLA
jgi:hypothetical protein